MVIIIQILYNVPVIIFQKVPMYFPFQSSVHSYVFSLFQKSESGFHFVEHLISKEYIICKAYCIIIYY